MANAVQQPIRQRERERERERERNVMWFGIMSRMRSRYQIIEVDQRIRNESTNDEGRCRTMNAEWWMMNWQYCNDEWMQWMCKVTPHPWLGFFEFLNFTTNARGGLWVVTPHSIITSHRWSLSLAFAVRALVAIVLTLTYSFVGIKLPMDSHTSALSQRFQFTAYMRIDYSFSCVTFFIHVRFVVQGSSDSTHIHHQSVARCSEHQSNHAADSIQLHKLMKDLKLDEADVGNSPFPAFIFLTMLLTMLSNDFLLWSGRSSVDVCRLGYIYYRWLSLKHLD